MTQNGSPKQQQQQVDEFRAHRVTTQDYAPLWLPPPSPPPIFDPKGDRETGRGPCAQVEPSKIPTNKPSMPRFPNLSPGTKSGQRNKPPPRRVFLASKHPDTALGQLAIGPSVKKSGHVDVDVRSVWNLQILFLAPLCRANVDRQVLLALFFSHKRRN